MSTGRGQALVELALCTPVILVLALGAVAAVQVLEAESGLQAATDAAASAAARAPDGVTAATEAQASFGAVIATYHLLAPTIAVSNAGFARGSTVSADSFATVELGAEAMLGLPARLQLQAHAQRTIEPWRSRP